MDSEDYSEEIPSLILDPADEDKSMIKRHFLGLCLLGTYHPQWDLNGYLEGKQCAC